MEDSSVSIKSFYSSDSVDKRRARSPRGKGPSLNSLLKAMVAADASDLHLIAGQRPYFRVRGELIRPDSLGQLDSGELSAMIDSLLNSEQRAELDQKLQLDLAFRFRNICRFRMNIFRERKSWAISVRRVALGVPSPVELGIPEVVTKMMTRSSGLILITGPTGSGKSTTLSSLIEHLNESKRVRILTIEDPIEYVFSEKKAAITQREVGTDVRTFEEALVSGLRQDPDVIMVGEMRDYETIRLVLKAAETGHLVVSTLHTVDARGSIERILDAVPERERKQIRTQLANSLAGVVSQQLVTARSGKRVLAAEVMVNSPSIQKTILDGDFERISELISQSNEFYGMKSLNQALMVLVNSGKISLDEAIRVSPRPDDIQMEATGIVRRLSG